MKEIVPSFRFAPTAGRKEGHDRSPIICFPSKSSRPSIFIFMIRTVAGLVIAIIVLRSLMPAVFRDLEEVLSLSLEIVRSSLEHTAAVINSIRI